MTNDQQIPSIEKLRINKAFWLAIVGLLLASALMIIAGWLFKWAPTDIVAVVGLFTSVVGTLVGAFFGVQVGSSGREQAEQRASKAEKKANELYGIAASSGDPALINKAQRMYSG